jgi:hypothetical protein
MLQQGNYDILEFSPPSSGMNQNISPETLPFSFAYLLENILPKPLGEGVVRFGTRTVTTIPPDLTILKLFPFVKSDGSKQLLLYVQEYIQDVNATTFFVSPDNPYRFSFSSPNNKARYVKDTPIKITYTYNGITTLIDAITHVSNAGNTVTVDLATNSFPPTGGDPAPVITSVFFSSGSLYAFDLETQTLSAALRQNLSVGCIPRFTTYLNTLMICNGVDRMMSWNGTDLVDVFDFIKEETANLTRVDNRNFSFTTPVNFNIADYAIGNSLQIKVNGVTTNTSIAASTLNQQVLTITTTTDLPQFTLNHTEIFYRAFPPRFSFLYVAHDRLWALGEGAAGIGFRSPQEALKVYYTSKPNTITGWFNERTKTVPSIDLSKKHGEPDNLEAICLVGGLMAFVGRQKTQVYQGQNPLPANEGGDFVFNSILSTGVIQGDLVLELPNDTFFITPYGLQSFSTLNVAKQFAATSLNAIDPLINQQVSTLLNSNRNYWRACSFKYDAGGIAGLKIGVNKTLVCLFSTSIESWSLFSGDFEKAISFLPLGNALYISAKNRLYQYGDGKDGSLPIYGDENGSAPVLFSWTLPVIQLNGKRFAAKRYEIQMSYPSSFTVRQQNEMTLSISGDLPKSYKINSPCRFDLRGDLLQTVPLTTNNPPEENSIGFRFDQPYGIFKDRFKFVASRFWMTLSGMTRDGPVGISKCKLYGVIERT